MVMISGDALVMVPGLPSDIRVKISALLANSKSIAFGDAFYAMMFLQNEVKNERSNQDSWWKAT